MWGPNKSKQFYKTNQGCGDRYDISTFFACILVLSEH